MAHEVLLPKIGLTMEEGVIEEWLVQTGDRVEVGQPLLVMATDKVDVEVEAESAGIFHPLADQGASLKPGERIAWLLEDGEEPPAGSAPTAVASKPLVYAVPESPSAPGDHGLSVNGHYGRLLASPNAKRLAGELGVDIYSVTGSGPGGRIVSEDIEDALKTEASQDISAAQSRVVSPLVRRLARAMSVDVTKVRGSGAGGVITRADLHRSTTASTPTGGIEAQTERIIPLKGMRAAIARNMTSSLQEMAQLTHGYEADVTELVRFRQQMKSQLGSEMERIPTITDFMARAVVLALVEHPELNASVRSDGIHVLQQVHLGIAVALPNGLVAPVVRNAQDLDLLDLSSEISRLSVSAREGKLSPDDLVGGTIAITTLGTYGVDFFTPVINPGNVAILGVGRIRDGIRWQDDRPLRTDVITLSLTFDHRAIDGAPAAEFLRTICQLLTKPLVLLAG